MSKLNTGQNVGYTKSKNDSIPENYPNTIVEAVYWDEKKKPLNEVLSDSASKTEELEDKKLNAPVAAGSAGQVLALDANGKPAWVNAATGGTYDGALSDSSTNAPQNKVVTAELTALGHKVRGLWGYFLDQRDNKYVNFTTTGTGTGATVSVTIPSQIYFMPRKGQIIQNGSEVTLSATGANYYYLVYDSDASAFQLLNTYNPINDTKYTIFAIISNGWGVSTHALRIECPSAGYKFNGSIYEPFTKDYTEALARRDVDFFLDSFGKRKVPGFTNNANANTINVGVYGVDVRGRNLVYVHTYVPYGDNIVVALWDSSKALMTSYKKQDCNVDGDGFVAQFFDVSTAAYITIARYSNDNSIIEQCYFSTNIRANDGIGVSIIPGYSLSLGSDNLPVVSVDTGANRSITPFLTISKVCGEVLCTAPAAAPRIIAALYDKDFNPVGSIGNNTNDARIWYDTSNLPTDCASYPDAVFVVFNIYSGHYSDGMIQVAWDSNEHQEIVPFRAHLSIGRLYGNPDFALKVKNTKFGLQDSSSVLGLLWFTDPHGYAEGLSRLLQFKKLYSGLVDDVLCTGDIVVGNYEQDFAWWKNISGSEDILIAVGNHDTAKPDNGDLDWYYYAGAQAYSRYIGPFISNWDVTNTQANKCYYYKDYACGVRLIVLDAMVMNPNEANYDSSQITWFTTALADAKSNNLAVLVAMHYANKHTAYDVSFQYKFANRDYGDTYADLSVWRAAVDTFQSGGGEFIAWICGDTHFDEFGYVTGYPNQLTITEAAMVLRKTTDVYRSAADKSIDLFNFLAVDTDLKIIKILRVGANMDCYMQVRDSICFNYSTHTLVANNNLK